MFPHHE